ncbi:ABC transporter permease [Yonghaparkia sp. Soil809]|uniref:ABC transporter permease n=1 Tax=Yonghaparkia sp. Soil809 TaxID=1736417 RepID=UPI0006F35754|nr:nitrate ABC transporter permease [Yonghaparkia sp. Soil809]
MSFDERGGAPVSRPSTTEGREAASREPADGERANAGRRVTLFGWAGFEGFSAAGTGLGRGGAGRVSVGTVLLGLVVPGVLLLVWLLASELTPIPDYLLPSPAQVVGAGVELANQGLLGTYILISLQRVLLGFAIGASIGLALGAVVGLSGVADRMLAPTLGAIRAVPSLAWLPLLTVFLGIFETPKITLIAIGAAFPVYTTVSAALRHVDPHLVEAGRAFGLGRLSLLTTVQLPAVVPSVISGLRLALAQAWLFLVAAELLASSMGLGFLLTDSANNGRTDRIFLAILLLAILGKTSDALVGLGERALLKRWS